MKKINTARRRRPGERLAGEKQGYLPLSPLPLYGALPGADSGKMKTFRPLLLTPGTWVRAMGVTEVNGLGQPLDEECQPLSDPGLTFGGSALGVWRD